MSIENRNAYLKLTGVITAIDPICITLPKPKEQYLQRYTSKEQIPCMLLREGDVMVRVPAIPASSIRGALRRAAIHEVVECLGRDADGKFGMSLDDYHYNAVGGIKAAGREQARDVFLVRDIKEKAPLIAAFGAGEIFVQGDLAVSYGRLLGRFAADQVTDMVPSIRADDVMRDPEMIDGFSEEDAQKYGRYTRLKKMVSGNRAQIQKLKRELIVLKRRRQLDEAEQARLDALRKEIADLEAVNKSTMSGGDMKGTINTPHSHFMIAAGSQFEHRIKLGQPTPITLGLVLATLRRFCQNCRLGGKAGSMSGTISGLYQIKHHDGVSVDTWGNPVETDAGLLFLEQGAFRIERPSDVVMEAWNAWRAAAENKLAGLDFSLPKSAIADLADDAGDQPGDDEAGEEDLA